MYFNVNIQPGDNLYVGAGAKIIGNTIIGNNCIIGANSVVKGNFKDNLIIAGVPAKEIQKKDKVCLKK